jgi:hypothetical protein
LGRTESSVNDERRATPQILAFTVSSSEACDNEIPSHGDWNTVVACDSWVFIAASEDTMLEHAGEALLVVVGAWRFLFSTTYRQRKLAEWRATQSTLGGKAAIAVEILAAIMIGILLPVWLIALIMLNDKL